MKKKILLIANLFVATFLSAQTIPYLVTSFGGTGYISTDFSQFNDLINTTPYLKLIKLDNNNKIVVGGQFSYQSGRKQDIFVARYNSNGTLDNNFDYDGRVLIQDVADSCDTFKNMFIDASNNIYVVYFVQDDQCSFVNASLQSTPFVGRIKITKILNNGTVDNSYGTNGTCIYNFTKTDQPSYDTKDNVTQDSNSNIYFSFSTNTVVNGKQLQEVICVNSNGQYHNKFNVSVGGFAPTKIYCRNNRLFVLKAVSTILTPLPLLLEKYSLQGIKENNFSLNLSTYGDFQSGYGNSNGYRLSFGADTNYFFYESNQNIYKFNSDGTPSTTFGVNGVSAKPIPLQSGFTTFDMLISKSGYLYMALTAPNVFARYKSNGYLDNSFDGDGVYKMPSNLCNTHPYAAFDISKDGILYYACTKLGIAAVKIENVITPGSNPSNISAFTNSALLSYSIYPNPSTGTFTIESQLPIKEPIVVYNTLGVAIQSISSKGESTVKVSGLTTGIYLVQIGSYKQKVLVE